MTIRFFYQDEKEMTREELAEVIGESSVNVTVRGARRSLEKWGKVLTQHFFTCGMVTTLIENAD